MQRFSLYDFTGQTGELSFKTGDVLELVKKEDSGESKNLTCSILFLIVFFRMVADEEERSKWLCACQLPRAHREAESCSASKAF